RVRRRELSLRAELLRAPFSDEHRLGQRRPGGALLAALDLGLGQEDEPLDAVILVLRPREVPLVERRGLPVSPRVLVRLAHEKDDLVGLDRARKLLEEAVPV